MRVEFVESEIRENECKKCCFTLRSTDCMRHKCHNTEREDEKIGYFVKVKSTKKGTSK